MFKNFKYSSYDVRSLYWVGVLWLCSKKLAFRRLNNGEEDVDGTLLSGLFSIIDIFLSSFQIIDSLMFAQLRNSGKEKSWLKV